MLVDTLLHVRNESKLTLVALECFLENGVSAPCDGAHIEVNTRRGWLPCQLATAAYSYPCDKLFNRIYKTPISATLFAVLILNSNHFLPMRISMRVVIAPTMVLTERFAWIKSIS